MSAWQVAEPLLRRGRGLGVAAAARVGLALRHLPGDSTGFGPPRRACTDIAAEVAMDPQASLHWIDESHKVERSQPRVIGGAVPEYYRISVSQTMPATWVAILPRARLRGADPAVISTGDALIEEVTNRFLDSPASHPEYRRLHSPRIRELPGTTAVISTAYAGSYYHWMLDVVPRLRLVAKAGFKIDRYVAPSALPFQRETLAALGIPPERVLAPSASAHWRAERLVVPSLAGTVAQSPAAAVKFLAENLAGKPESGTQPGPRRRLLISRADAKRRAIANEDQLFAALAPLGFERVLLGALEVREQVRMFAGAEAVVGAHGAGLTNIAFCPPDACAVEIALPRYTPPCFWTMAEARGLRHQLVLGSPARPGLPPGQWSDIVVDPDIVLGALAADGIR